MDADDSGNGIHNETGQATTNIHDNYSCLAVFCALHQIEAPAHGDVLCDLAAQIDDALDMHLTDSCNNIH